MYQLQFFDRSCRVVDEDDRVLFVGSYRECEEWLDLQENVLALAEQARRVAEHRPGWFHGLWQWFVHRRHTTGLYRTREAHYF